MLSALATAAALFTPFSIGPIDNLGFVKHPTTFAYRGHRIEMALPPRSALTDKSRCQWLNVTRVTAHGRQLSVRWSKDHTLQEFGVTVTFDGVQVTNYSSRWVNVYGYTFDGCN